jgi:hypothetical protein
VTVGYGSIVGPLTQELSGGSLLTALEADPAHPGWGPDVTDPGAW